MTKTRLGLVLAVAAIAIGCATGITLTDRGTRVTALSQADMPGGCRLVGDVTIGMPPDAARPRTEEQLQILMRNKAGEMGANHVVTEFSEQRTEAGAVHYVGRGIAYACDASTAPETTPEGDTGGGETTEESTSDDSL